MSAEQLRIEIIGPETVERHLGQLMIPDGMKPLLRQQMETRGLRVAAGFIGDVLVTNGLWNPDSPVRPDILEHIPHGTPSVSMVETRESHRGNGYAGLVLDAIASVLQTEGHRQIYLLAEPGSPYARPDGSTGTLDMFYTNRGYQDWGHGPVPLIAHPADDAPPAPAELNVYIKNLVPEASA